MAKKEVTDDVIVVGAASHPLRDLYHRVLTMSWPAAIGAIGGGFLGVNAVFALGYLITGGIEGARPGAFTDAFFFSAQTLGTIGYGAMHPVSDAANAIVVVESMMSVVFTALATGIVFARFARSSETVIFSKNPCISPMDGAPTLSMRIGNDRENGLFDAHVRVSLVRTQRTAENVTMYRMKDLVLARDRTPLLARSWTILHLIDETSPLHGMTPEACERDEVELVVSVVGTDDTTLQPVHGRKRYLAADVRWGWRLADALRELPDGRLELDVRRFDDVVETEPTESFPYPRRKSD